MCAVDVEGEINLEWHVYSYGFIGIRGRSNKERRIGIQDSAGLLGNGTWKVLVSCLGNWRWGNERGVLTIKSKCFVLEKRRLVKVKLERGLEEEGFQGTESYTKKTKGEKI